MVKRSTLAPEENLDPQSGHVSFPFVKFVQTLICKDDFPTLWPSFSKIVLTFDHMHKSFWWGLHFLFLFRLCTEVWVVLPKSNFSSTGLCSWVTGRKTAGAQAGPWGLPVHRGVMGSNVGQAGWEPPEADCHNTWAERWLCLSFCRLFLSEKCSEHSYTQTWIQTNNYCYLLVIVVLSHNWGNIFLGVFYGSISYFYVFAWQRFTIKSLKRLD